jgi:hypothetical protein
MNGPKATSALSPFDSELRTLIGAARRSGTKVTFTPAIDGRSGRPHAINVRPVAQ